MAVQPFSLRLGSSFQEWWCIGAAFDWEKTNAERHALWDLTGVILVWRWCLRHVEIIRIMKVDRWWSSSAVLESRQIEKVHRFHSIDRRVIRSGNAGFWRMFYSRLLSRRSVCRREYKRMIAVKNMKSFIGVQSFVEWKLITTDASILKPTSQPRQLAVRKRESIR